MFRWVIFGFITVLCYGVSLKQTSAYEARVYEIMSDDAEVITPVDTEQLWLGELSGQPHMYRIDVDATSTLSASLWSLEVGMNNFSLIVVRDNPIRGVEEVARLSSREAAWIENIDRDSRVPYWEGGVFSQEVGPGVYRIEVSTPSNEGKYILVNTADEKGSWWTRVHSARLVQKFSGYGWWYMLVSPLLYVPIGVFALLIMSRWYWRRRHKHNT